MTDSELAVARLVAQGLTNREVAERLFVSQHTVSGHLRHVFAKLDVNSRVELTRLAGVHDPGPEPAPERTNERRVVDVPCANLSRQEIWHEHAMRNQHAQGGEWHVPGSSGPDVPSKRRTHGDGPSHS